MMSRVSSRCVSMAFPNASCNCSTSTIETCLHPRPLLIRNNASAAGNSEHVGCEVSASACDFVYVHHAVVYHIYPTCNIKHVIKVLLIAPVICFGVGELFKSGTQASNLPAFLAIRARALWSTAFPVQRHLHQQRFA